MVSQFEKVAPPPRKDNLVELEIFLKSGHSIKVRCEQWKFIMSEDGQIVGYEFSGMKIPKTLGINPEQIAGFIEK